MARKILNDTTYTFNPTTRTVTIPRYIAREKLVLITNVTSNVVIYNFSDSTLTATSYTALGGQTQPASQLGGDAGLTTIILNYNTSSMNATDKLQILIDEYEEKFFPAEVLLDPADKLRVSTPQSLIDTDFEYSLQTTKWEFFQQQNFVASVYTRPSDTPLAPIYGGAGFSIISPTITTNGSTGTISGLSMPAAAPVGTYVYIVESTSTTVFAAVRYPVYTSGNTTNTLVFSTSAASGTYTPQLVVVGGVAGTANNPCYAVFSVSNNITLNGSNLTSGSPILVQEAVDEAHTDGTFLATYVNQADGAIGYLTKGNFFSQSINNKATTVIYQGNFYATGYGIASQIPIQAVSAAATAAGSAITVTTFGPHNLIPGAPIYVGNTTQTNANIPTYVAAVPQPNQFTYYNLNALSASGSIIQTTPGYLYSATLTPPNLPTYVITRPEGFQLHRSGDGGISITPGNNVVGAQSMRQTRRYFRYQAGKGIQFSTAATFKPNYDITALSVNGSILTVTTDQDHGLQPGAIVNLRNILSIASSDNAIYNNTFSVLPTVQAVAKTFAVQLSGTPVDSNPGGALATVEVADAKGYATRLGLMDDMNGFFWEFDGTFLNAVRRNGTTILRGTINVLTGSPYIIGTGSTYTKQVTPGDKVIIRGVPYEVAQVISDNVIAIAPAYRAATPATTSGTAGLPFAYINAASSTTQTIQLSQQTTAQYIQLTGQAGTGSGVTGTGITGVYVMQATVAATGSPNITGTSGTTTLTLSTSANVFPGMLISSASGIPANTYVAQQYVPTSLTCPITNPITATLSTQAANTYYVPAAGMTITGIGIPNNTQINSTNTPAAGFTGSFTLSIYFNQALTANTTASTYTFGAIAGSANPTNVISVPNTYGIFPGMVITGTGVPGNCLVSGLIASGSGIILNQAITASVTNGATLTFLAQNSLYYLTQTTSAATTSGNILTLSSVVGINVGSQITGSANIPLGSFVTGINTATSQITFYSPYPFASTQGVTGTVASNTTLGFGSRIFVYQSTQSALNGVFPIISAPGTSHPATVTFQTQTAATVTSTSSTPVNLYGYTKVYAEDQSVKKYYVREIRSPVYLFNLDRLDGTGPTGYNQDLTKIQMVYLDYTWYGAGFIRWGIRATQGDIIYAHKVQHGNREYQAYQRSGNVPGRFEAINFGARQPITAQIASTGYSQGASPTPGTINIFDASRYFIPGGGSANGERNNGEVFIEGEVFYYTGISSTTGPAPWGTNTGGVTSLATVGTVTVSSGSLVSVTLTSGGAGYTAAPPVTIGGGGGAGAVAKAILNPVTGSITAIQVTSGGYGYTSAPNVYIGANQLTGCFRESTVVALGNLAGTPTVTAGSTAITNVTNSNYYFVGMVLPPLAAFGYVPAKITGIGSNTLYVNQICLTGQSGALPSVTPINRGTATASVHYPYNNTGNPVANAWNTTQQMTPSIQHWGVSAIMDGRFDADKSYVFTTPKQTASTLQANQTAPLISLRVSPSASNGFARNFGIRDIIMRMQANLYQMDVYNSGSFLVTVKYNCSSPVFTPALWTANTVGSGSLSQVIYHNPSDIVTGGDIVIAFYANASGGTFFTASSADLTVVKDLGNSVYGGDGVYPDGPDVVTIFATNLSAANSQPIFSRISWTEAQA